MSLDCGALSSLVKIVTGFNLNAVMLCDKEEVVDVN